MKKLNLVLTILLFALAATAQTAKFDIVTYTAPPGYAVEKDAQSTRFSKDAGSNYCAISIIRSIDSNGDSLKNFDLLWKTLATDGLNAGTPQRGKGGDKNGWQAEVGMAGFEKDGLKGAALLTTYTGNGKVVAILSITNSEEFQSDIEAFVDSVKLPQIAAQKAPAATPVAAATGEAAKLIGRWQRTSSSQPVYGNSASWGTAGYTRSRYEFNANGAYTFTERTFRMTHPVIFIVRENGRYSTTGNTLTITPAKSTITAYNKAGGTDALGSVASTQNRKLETVAYKFTFHYFSGIQEWNLVLQADSPTQRDGQFSGNTTFNNAWYFDQKFTNNDLTATRVD